MAEQIASVSGLRWPMTKTSLIIFCWQGRRAAASGQRSALSPPNSQRRQHFRRVLLRLHFRPDFFDLAIGPDEKRDAIHAQIFPAHETFLAPHAVSLDDFFVLVRQQGEGQLELLAKLAID